MRRPGQQACGTVPQAYVGHSDHGLIMHLSWKHGGKLPHQKALPNSDRWIEELVWYMRPSDHGVGIIAIIVGWMLQRETW